MQEIIPDLRSQHVRTALQKLTVFSLLIIGLPLLSMFAFKKFIFENIFDYNASDSLLYSAIVAVVLVHIILILFVYTAYTEDKPASKQD